MPIQKKPIYVFEMDTDQGINEVPEYRIILVENTHELYFLKHKNNLNSMSTIQDAIANGNLVRFWNESNDGFDSLFPVQYTIRWNNHYLYGVSPDEPPENKGNTGNVWFQYDMHVPPPPPEAPTNLTASDDRIDGILISWSNPSGPITGFYIYRDGVLLDLVLDSSATEYFDENVTVQQTYTYYIEAYNAGGVSPPSNSDTGVMCDKIVYKAVVDYDQVSGSGASTVTKNADGNFIFTVPNGVDHIQVCMVAGGGSGAAYTVDMNNNVGPRTTGGLAGEEYEGRINVTPGDNMSIIVGAGGAAVTAEYPNGAYGMPGESTIFAGISLNGGGRGCPSNGENGDPTCGYFGVGNPGPDGCGGGGYHDGAYFSDTSGDRAWGGQASSFGDGGNAGGRVGPIDGGIGAGGGGNSAENAGQTTSGAGGNGQVIISWGISNC